MARFFSISFAMMLLLISVGGPLQPVEIAEDVPAEVNSAEAEIQQDDELGDEQAEPREDEGVDLPDGDEDGSLSEEEDFAPVDEPAEDANAPPVEEETVVDDSDVDEPLLEEPAVDDEPDNDEPLVDEPEVGDEPVAEDPYVEDTAPVVDEESVVEEEVPAVQDEPVIDETADDSDLEDVIISPNAVEPEPGECGGIDQEPCPSGGETSSTVEVNILILSRIYDDTWMPPHTNATVTIKDDQGLILGDLNTAAGDGWVTIELGTGKTYTLDITAKGSDPVTGYAITPTASNTEFRVQLPVSRGVITVSGSISRPNLLCRAWPLICMTSPPTG